MKKKFIFILIISLIVVSFVIVILRIPEFDYLEKDLKFTYDNKIISGRMALPKNQSGPFPVAVFVHGDGPINKTGNDDYLYHWEKLTDEGIACFSWDKQGVGDSEGNWEHQDMKDRAEEVITAIDFLKSQPEVIDNKIGLIGFSQAGWVMPLVSTLSDYPDYIVSVSGAINVFEQGDYLNRKRLTAKGFNIENIDTYIELKHKMYSLIDNGMSYDDYKIYWNKHFKTYEGDDASPMSYDRYIFSKNSWPDARDHLKNIKCPVLAVYGDKDLNVDVNQSISVYREQFKKSGHNDYTIKVYKGGTHALTKDKLFKDGKISFFEILIYGEGIYVDGYLDLITNWIKGRV